MGLSASGLIREWAYPRVGLSASGFIREWAYPRDKKNVSEKGGLIREWAYPRVGLSAEFYGIGDGYILELISQYLVSRFIFP